MGCYEINIVSERRTRVGFVINSTYKYYSDTLQEKDVACIWLFVSNNKSFAAKQKISFGTCIFQKEGTPYITLHGSGEDTPRNIFKRYLLAYASGAKLMKMTFTTSRNRVITISVAYRKE